MDNQTQITRINLFLNIAAPIVIGFAKAFLQEVSFEVAEEGQGPDFSFCVRSGERQVRFFLQNLLLEIATVDRDAEPLTFDERLIDFNFFISKTTDIVESKIRILTLLFGEKDIDAALDNVMRQADKYERLRIIRFDHKPD